MGRDPNEPRPGGHPAITPAVARRMPKTAVSFRPLCHSTVSPFGRVRHRGWMMGTIDSNSAPASAVVVHPTGPRSLSRSQSDDAFVAVGGSLIRTCVCGPSRRTGCGGSARSSRLSGVWVRVDDRYSRVALAPSVGPVGRAIVGQKSLDGHASASEADDCSLPHTNRGGLVVSTDLGVSDAGAVADHGVHECGADQTVAVGRDLLASKACCQSTGRQPPPSEMLSNVVTSMWMTIPGCLMR